MANHLNKKQARTYKLNAFVVQQIERLALELGVSRTAVLEIAITRFRHENQKK